MAAKKKAKAKEKAAAKAKKVAPEVAPTTLQFAEVAFPAVPPELTAHVGK